MFLSEAVRIEIPVLGNQLMGMYVQLSVMAAFRHMQLWKMSPKMHLFLHLCIHQAPLYGNPRFYWTYGDEDLAGRLITMADKLHPETLTVSLLMKWLHVVFDQQLDVCEL